MSEQQQHEQQTESRLVYLTAHVENLIERTYDLERTLLWIAEVIGEFASPIQAPCSTCGHGRNAHSVGGDADNPTPWPCRFPQSLGGPVALCNCSDYTPIR